MNSELCAPLTNLKLYLKFNEGIAGGTNTSVNSAIDDSGNGYNGVLTNLALTGANALGCDSIVTIDLTINTPTSGIDVQSSCGNYTWIDGNTYTTNNNTVTFTLTNSAGCDSVVTLNLTLSTIQVTVTQNGNTLTANLSGATYQWLTCPSMYLVSRATEQSFTPTVSGEYALLISSGVCVDTLICFTVGTVGIVDNDFGDALVVYPNPTLGQFSIALGDNYQSTNVTISDMNGRTIKKETFTNSQLLNLSLDAPAGIYILHLETAEKQAIIRLIKQ